MKKLDHSKIKNKRKTRFRKSKEHLAILEKAFQESLDGGDEWEYEYKCDLALKLDFTFAQVSKWYWDRRKKAGMLTEKRVFKQR